MSEYPDNATAPENPDEPMIEKLERLEFHGTYDSYLRIHKRLGEIGNTHQQAGEVVFCGGTPPTIRLQTGMGTDLARPHDTIIVVSQHRLRVERSEAATIARMTSHTPPTAAKLRAALSELRAAREALGRYAAAWVLSNQYDEDDDEPAEAWHDAYMGHVGLDPALAERCKEPTPDAAALASPDTEEGGR